MSDPLSHQDRGPATLFLCVANSARSQMAEGLARQLSRGAPVLSAGSRPSQVNPLAVQVMDEIGIDLTGHRSKGIDEVSMATVSRVVTLCAEEVCPAVPRGVEHLHWPMPDPAAVPGDGPAQLAAFREVRDELRSRLEALFPSGSGDPAGQGPGGS